VKDFQTFQKSSLASPLLLLTDIFEIQISQKLHIEVASNFYQMLMTLPYFLPFFAKANELVVPLTI